MPQTSGGKRAAVSGGGPDDGDRISALPDGVLHHILGFLPAHEAVRTSVLAPRWRRLWRCAGRLLVTNLWRDGDSSQDGDDMRSFVNPLLLLRDHESTLDEVRFELGPPSAHQIDIWIRHVLLLRARVLAVRLGLCDATLSGPPLVSRHLTRLELGSLHLDRDMLDFASCPALEVLEVRGCAIHSERISSQSLKHLLIVDSTFTCNTRARISVPAVVWLLLDGFKGKLPLLEAMPSLQTALVKPAFCARGVFRVPCGKCAVCRGDDDLNACVAFLGALSSASNLELTAHPTLVTFRENLRWCPTFSNLKKLLLNESYAAIDMHSVVLILRNSPVLENLTLQLREYTKQLGVVIHYNPMEKFDGISEHLKVVKVNCEEVDERVFNILKFLSTLDIGVTLKRTRDRRKSVSISSYYEHWFRTA